jgi:hypothetical protein
MLLDGIPIEKCGFDAIIEISDSPLQKCIYLAERIKDSPILRRRVKQRTEWLETLIEELKNLGMTTHPNDN